MGYRQWIGPVLVIIINNYDAKFNQWIYLLLSSTHLASHALFAVGMKLLICIIYISDTKYFPSFTIYSNMWRHAALSFDSHAWLEIPSESWGKEDKYQSWLTQALNEESLVLLIWFHSYAGLIDWAIEPTRHWQIYTGIDSNIEDNDWLIDYKEHQIGRQDRFV